MNCIKVDIPKEICEIDDELKAGVNVKFVDGDFDNGVD